MRKPAESMKLFFVVVVVTVARLILPAYGWSQRLPVVLAHPVSAKPESKQARYARLDQYAQHLPEAQATTLEKLAASLGTQAHSDEDKARLIFAWLTYHIAYDAGLLSSDTTQYYRRCLPEHVLKSRKAICQGYADLFTELATRMKLRASTVVGHARTWADTGDLLTVANGHAWNAYQIAGTWHLADATWGAGGTLTDTNKFQQQFKPFWFDTPPAQMLFSHLPDSATWQLVLPTVTAAIYQNWPYIAPGWFQLVSGESMRHALGTNLGQLDSLPEVQSSSLGIRLIQAPKSGKLIANQPIKFIFSVPAGVEMFIVTDTSRVPLQAVGCCWQAIITPTAGNVWVLAQRKDDFTTSVNLLKYRIVLASSPNRWSKHSRNASYGEAAYLRP